METRIGLGASPALNVFSDESHLTSLDIRDRVARRQAEAAGERLARSRDGLRQHLGRALMALGRAIHGLEPDQPIRPALDTW